MHDLSTQATLRYLVPGGEKPVYIASEGGADAQLKINAAFEDRIVAIGDARRFTDSPAVRNQHNSRETASVVHNDYTNASAQKRLRDLLPEDDAKVRINTRFAIINVWRSIAGPVIQTPLSCCDAQTLDEADIVASERRAKDRIGELELVSFNSGHRWYYYPEMTKEEVLLIKTFDSAEDGRARRSVHCAFNNPLAPSDAAPRESMESRMLVFY
jgi:hypothetical protein